LRYPQKFRSWKENRNTKIANNKLTIGLLNLIVDNYSVAEKFLAISAKKAKINILNTVGLATIYNAAGNYDLRDQQFVKLILQHPEEKLLLKAVQAKLQYKAEQYAQAEMAVKDILKEDHKNLAALKVLEQVLSKINNLSELNVYLPRFIKYNVLSEAQINRLQIEIAKEQLQQQDNYENLKSCWRKTASNLQEKPAVIAAYTKKLLQFDKTDSALELLENYLDSSWNNELVAIYGRVCARTPQAQLAKAESWYITQKHNAVLLLAMGRIAIRFKYWAKAQEYLTKSLEILPDPTAYFLLSEVYENTGETHLAIDALKNGLLGQENEH